MSHILFIFATVESFCCILFLIFSQLYAQHFVSVHAGKGALWQHTSKSGHLISQNPYFAEVYIGHQTDGSRKWHHQNRFPRYGLSLHFQTFGNSKQLGNSFAAASFAEIPFSSKAKRIQFSFKTEVGIAYVSKSFDLIRNHKNVAIGSKLNAFVSFSGLWKIQIFPKFSVIPSLSLVHVSNGRFKVPNLGINTIYPGLGVQYQFKNVEKTEYPQNVSESKQKIHFMPTFFVGKNQNVTPLQENLLATSVGLCSYYQFNENQLLGLGIDIFYEQMHQLRSFPKDSNLRKISLSKGTTSSLKMNYLYRFGKISVPIEWGFYWFSSTKIFPNGRNYQRLGLRYRVIPKLFLQISLKTHFAVAHNIELGLVYHFIRKK